MIEARDLDTDERSRIEFEIDAPSDEPSKHAQLVTMVSRVHPNAVLRSFGGDAASFLGPNHLVVAHYGQISERASVTRVQPSRSHEQQPLFAS